MASQLSDKISVEGFDSHFFVPKHSSAGAWAWLLQRITGALLLVILALHLLAVNLGFFTDPAAVEAQVRTGDYLYSGPASYYAVWSRIHSPWFIIDITLLIIAVYHGMNGLKMVLYDVVTTESKRKLVSWILTLISLLMIGVGLWASFAVLSASKPPIL